MKPALMVISFTLCLVASPAGAEIYRWVDDKGRVHFSDRAVNDDAQAVSDKLKQVNITDGEPVQEFGERRPQSEAEAIINEQELVKQRKREQALADKCAKARERLKMLAGPVTFVREDGTNFDITEQERAEKEQSLRLAIADYCN